MGVLRRSGILSARSSPVSTKDQTIHLRADGRSRVVIERSRHEIDCGRFPVKRVVSDRVVVEADVFADGHDQLACEVLYRSNHGRRSGTGPQ